MEKEDGIATQNSVVHPCREKTTRQGAHNTDRLLKLPKADGMLPLNRL